MCDPSLRSEGRGSKIRIISLRKTSHGNLRAFADVQLGEPLVIRDFRLVQQPNRRPWVSPPTRECLDADGRKRYTPLVELSDSLKRAVEAAVLEAWQREVADA